MDANLIAVVRPWKLRDTKQVRWPPGEWDAHVSSTQEFCLRDCKQDLLKTIVFQSLLTISRRKKKTDEKGERYSCQTEDIVNPLDRGPTPLYHLMRCCATKRKDALGWDEPKAGDVRRAPCLVLAQQSCRYDAPGATRAECNFSVPLSLWSTACLGGYGTEQVSAGPKKEAGLWGEEGRRENLQIHIFHDWFSHFPTFSSRGFLTWPCSGGFQQLRGVWNTGRGLDTALNTLIK